MQNMSPSDISEERFAANQSTSTPVAGSQRENEESLLRSRAEESGDVEESLPKLQKSDPESESYQSSKKMRLRFDETPVARSSGGTSNGLQEEGHIDSVQDYVDTQVSQEDKYKARRAELVKLEDDFVAIKPVAMRSVPHGTKILNFVWVETIKEGCAKAVWTVADVRGKETRDDVSNTFALGEQVVRCTGSSTEGKLCVSGRGVCIPSC